MKRSESGQSLLELAVSLVFLLILVAGVVDLGRMIFYYLSMRDAAEEGLIYGSTFPTHCDQIEEHVWSAMGDGGQLQVTTTENGVPCLSATTNDACLGKEIEIHVVNSNFPITMPFLGTFLGKQSLTLDASVKGTILRPACH